MESSLINDGNQLDKIFEKSDFCAFFMILTSNWISFYI